MDKLEWCDLERVGLDDAEPGEKRLATTRFYQSSYCQRKERVSQLDDVKQHSCRRWWCTVIIMISEISQREWWQSQLHQMKGDEKRSRFTSLIVKNNWNKKLDYHSLKESDWMQWMREILFVQLANFFWSLKLECEKLASEKIEIQRHYVMVRIDRSEMGRQW
jgi:hypothetical protein